MILGSLAVLLSFLPFFPQIILFLALPVVVYVVFIITSFGQMGFVLTLPSLPAVIWVGYYLILAALLIMLKNAHEKDPTH